MKSMIYEIPTVRDSCHVRIFALLKIISAPKLTGIFPPKSEAAISIHAHGALNLLIAILKYLIRKYL